MFQLFSKSWWYSEENMYSLSFQDIHELEEKDIFNDILLQVGFW